jgi:hypothetical protein
MKKIILLTIIAFILGLDLIAQVDTESDKEIDSIVEELIFSDSESLLKYIEQLNNYQVIYTSIGFNDKAHFLGRDLGLDQNYLSAQIFYEHSIGVFFGISGAYYSEFDPKWDLTILTGGYGKYFGKHDNYNYELSYNRYIFTDNESNDFENSLDASFGAETNNNSFGISANLVYFFGKKQGFQNSFDINGDIDLFKLSNKAKVTFTPLLTFQFGSENIDTSRIDDLISDFPVLDRIINSFEKYDLRNIQLQLPLNLKFDNLQIEAGYNFNFPKALEFEQNLDNTSFFNLRVSYIIDLK